MPPTISTLGELRASGWVSRSVKSEIRANAVARVAAGKPLFEGVLGYEDTVMPQLENALLAGHDVILLGDIETHQDATGEIEIDISTQRPLDHRERARLVSGVERSLTDANR